MFTTATLGFSNECAEVSLSVREAPMASLPVMVAEGFVRPELTFQLGTNAADTIGLKI